MTEPDREPSPPPCHLLVDGQAVAPRAEPGDILRFRLALPAQAIRLVSPAGRPVAGGLGTDARLLGLQLFRLCWRQGERRLEVPLTSDGFAEGFHDLEHTAYRWTNGDARLGPALLPDWQGEVELELRALPMPPELLRAANAHPDATLLAGFESLGDDCELGFVQRHFDATPPLGLFRWSGSSYAQLLAGLDSAFAGLGEPAHTFVVVRNGEYRLRTPYLSLHTFHPAGDDTPEDQAAMLRRGCATLRLLRRKLLAEIAEARRCFVFKSAEPEFDEAAMRRLHAALRAHGPAPLLCVGLRPEGAAEEGVRRLAPGLYAGAVGRFVLAEGPYDEWHRLCRETAALRREDGA